MSYKAGAFLETKEHWTDTEAGVIEPGMNVTEAMKAAGLYDVEIALAESVERIPIGNNNFIEEKAEKKSLYLTNVPWTDNGVQNMDRKIVWWNGISNKEYAQSLDRLSADYQIEAVTQMGKRGEFIIFQFRLPDFRVENDPNGGHSSLLTFAENRHTGERWIGNIIRRIFCQNQFANQQNKGLRSQPWGANAKLWLDFQVDAEKAMKRHLLQLNDLFTKKVDDKKINEVANALFPLPKPRGKVKKVEQAVQYGYNLQADNVTAEGVREEMSNAQADYEREMNRQANQLNAFFGVVNESFEEGGDKNAYWLWQACTNHMTHNELFRGNQGIKQQRAIFGETAKALDRAYAVVRK